MLAISVETLQRAVKHLDDANKYYCTRLRASQGVSEIVTLPMKLPVAHGRSSLLPKLSADLPANLSSKHIDHCFHLLECCLLLKLCHS